MPMRRALTKKLTARAPLSSIGVSKVLPTDRGHAEPHPDKTYAIKILSKYQLIKNKQVDHVFNEMTL